MTQTKIPNSSRIFPEMRTLSPEKLLFVRVPRKPQSLPFQRPVGERHNALRNHLRVAKTRAHLYRRRGVLFIKRSEFSVCMCVCENWQKLVR